jgi:hypothetical protein
MRTAAEKDGKTIYVTEMWDYWDPSNGDVAGAISQNRVLGDWFAEYTNPDLHTEAQFSFSLNNPISYQFLDISNNNAQKGEVHAQTGLWIRNAVLSTGKLRPINNVKIYGGDLENIWAGNRQDGKERFCRNIFSGHAAVRFHRPIFGMGLDIDAQHFIRSMRTFTDQVDFFSFVPANHMLTDRQPNEAFCMANHENEYLVYFPAGGEVRLNVTAGTYVLEKLHIPTSTWANPETVELPGLIRTDTEDHWGLILRKTPISGISPG